MNIDHEFPKKFLSSVDVDGPFNGVPLTIKSVGKETFRGQNGEAPKLVVHFYETPQTLALSAANRQMLAARMGPETDDWLRAVITLGCVNADFQGRLVRSVRVISIITRSPAIPNSGNGALPDETWIEEARQRRLPMDRERRPPNGRERAAVEEADRRNRQWEAEADARRMREEDDRALRQM